MGLNVADIMAAVRLNLETGEFEASAAKAADKAGDTMGQRMGGKLKTALAGGVGAAFGAGLGMALNGAVELNAAMSELQASTGMTADEAKEAQKSMVNLFKGNLQSFAQISDAMASVHNDLGLVGEEAERTTEAFLKFSTATGQEAVGAVQAFDDMLDSWGLTAADSQQLMDKLIVSHQEFGGSIEASQSTLAALAPSMRAANLEIDDGIALLNLFGAKGIDANTASAAFSKALTKIESPEQLQILIDEISATEDPFARAEKAAQLFGAKAGAKLGNALAGANLEDYKISIEESAGATAEAAEVMENSFGNKFKMMMKGVQGTLAEFGAGFGELAMLAAAFGPQLTKGLLAGLGGLTGVVTKTLLPKITGAILATGPGAALAGSQVGTMAGAAMGAALPIAFAAAAGIGIALAFKALVLDPGLQKQTEDIGTSIGEQIAGGTTDELLKDVQVLEDGIAKIKAIPLGDFLYGDQIRALEEQKGAVLSEIERRSVEAGAAVPQGMADGAAQTMPQWSGKVSDIVTFFGTSMTGVKNAAKVAGADGMAALAQGITAARQAPLDAFDTLKTMLKNAMSPMKEQARLAGILTSKELAKGLKSGDPAVRAQAQAVAKQAADRLGELAAGGGKAGRAAMAALDKNITSGIPEVRDAAVAAKAAAQAKLEALKGPAGTAGTQAGNQFANKLESAASGGTIRINASVGFRGKIPQMAEGGAIKGLTWVGEEGPELYVPPRAGRILSHDDSMAAVSGRGGSAPAARGPITVIVNNPKPEPASTSTRRELRKLALSGSPV